MSRTWNRTYGIDPDVAIPADERKAIEEKCLAFTSEHQPGFGVQVLPLVFMMLSQHATWAASPTWGPITLGIIVLVGWALVYHLYDRAKKVPGF